MKNQITRRMLIDYNQGAKNKQLRVGGNSSYIYQFIALRYDTHYGRRGGH